MANDVLTVVGGVACAAGAAGAGAVGVSVLRRPAPYLPAGHALVGRDAVDPLPDVLRRGLAGLTVPVRPGPHGELFIGPGAPQPGRTLRRLVLTPLFARATSRGGRLRRDQQVPFRLVVEFVGPSRDAETLLRAYRMLNRQLRDHAPLLSRCVAGRLDRRGGDGGGGRHGRRPRAARRPAQPVRVRGRHLRRHRFRRPRRPPWCR